MKISILNKYKKIIIVLLVIVVVLSAMIVFFLNYDIKVVSDASIEYKNLLEFTNFDYYRNNHLMVMEDENYFLDVYGNNMDNKTIQSSLYYSPIDEGKCIKSVICVDNNNDVSYTWFFYEGKQYVKYNNNSTDTYTLYNFEKSINAFDMGTVPNLDIFLNYKPQFQSKYQNANVGEENRYVEVYKLYFEEDDFYNKCLSKFVNNSKIAYLRVVINNMNLITSVGISLEPTGDYVFGPFAYSYYYDKQYDLSFFYDYINMDKNNIVTITFKDVNDDREIDKVNIDKKEVLFVEKGSSIEGIYLDKECTNNYQDFMNKKALDSSIPNIFNSDSVLYVKYK